MEQTPQENDHQIEQNIESDNSFDAKLKSGENNIREIFDNDVKASDIHPELALLFSSIDPNDVAEVEPDRTSNKIKVTEYGIKINDEIYPYNDSMKEQVFLYETKRLMGKSEDLQDMYGNLEEERTSLRDAYIERIQNTYIDKAKEPHLKKIKEYEEKIKSGYAKNTIFTAANQVIREMFDDDQLSDVGCKLVYADAFSCQEKDKAVSNGQYQLSEAKKDGEYLSKTIEKDRQRRQGEEEIKAKK